MFVALVITIEPACGCVSLCTKQRGLGPHTTPCYHSNLVTCLLKHAYSQHESYLSEDIMVQELQRIATLSETGSRKRNLSSSGASGLYIIPTLGELAHTKHIPNIHSTRAYPCSLMAPPIITATSPSPSSSLPEPINITFLPDDINISGISDELHASMDNEVLELAGPNTPTSHALLACVVCTCSELDQKYGHIREAKDFLTRAGEPLETELKDVWERKSFRRIRLIGVFATLRVINIDIARLYSFTYILLVVQLQRKTPIPIGLAVVQGDRLV